MVFKKEHEFTQEQNKAIEKIKEALEKKKGAQKIGEHLSKLQNKEHQMEVLWAIYYPQSFYEDHPTQDANDKNIAEWYHSNLPQSYHKGAIKWLKENLEAYNDVDNIERHFKKLDSSRSSLDSSRSSLDSPRVSLEQETKNEKLHSKPKEKEKHKKSLLTKFSKPKEMEKQKVQKQDNKKAKNKRNR